MTISRISFAALVFALISSGALAQSDDEQTPPPPKSDSSREQPPYVDTSDLKSDEPESDQPSQDQPPPPRKQRPADDGRDVSTDDLQSDEGEPSAPRQLGEPRQLAPHEDSGTVESAPLPPPDAPPRPLGQPRQLAPHQDSGAVETAPLAPPEPARAAVQVETLGTFEGPAAGTLDPSNGGLEPNMWMGSQRADIEGLLTRVPVASPDTATRALAKRVILTKADTPPGNASHALITIRIRKLLEAGLADDAAALAAQGAVKDDADFARVQAEAILIAGRANDACGGLTASRQTEGDLFWLQLRLYCAAASGDSATADLTRSVIKAQGKADVAFDVLVDDAVNGEKKPPGPIAKPSAIHVFLLRKAGLSIGADVAKSLGPSADVLVLRDTRNSPEARLTAAERAVRAGAARFSELRAVADAQTIAPDRLAGAQAAAAKLPFLAGQALLRRAAQVETRPAVKAALVHQALTLGDKAGLFEVAANLQADVVASIDVKSVPREQAPLVGWALLIAGRANVAGPWLGDNDIARAVLGLASGKDDGAQVALNGIAMRLTADPAPADAGKPIEVLLLGLYDALGRTMPPDAKTAAMTVRSQRLPGRRPDDAAMQKMLAAAGTPDRKGEAILRILDIVGPKGPGDLAPDVTAEIVHALKDMGLQDSARAFALHALLLYRPPAQS